LQVAIAAVDMYNQRGVGINASVNVWSGLTCQKGRHVILIGKLKASTSLQPVWRARIINDGKASHA